jgi:hypothetical protein
MRSLARVLACAAVAGAFSLFGPAVPAFADCNPDTALFDDDFEFMDASWGDPDDKYAVEDGALVVHDYREQVNFSTQNTGAHVCVETTIAEAPKPDQSNMGLIFWWQDWDNYYSFVYWPDGNGEVRRVLKGKFSTLFSVDTLAIKKGVGATNKLEIVLRPKDATLIVNGTEVKRFKGVQPKDGGVIGISAVSPEDAPGTFKFDNFIVSE